MRRGYTAAAHCTDCHVTALATDVTSRDAMLRQHNEEKHPPAPAPEVFVLCALEYEDCIPVIAFPTLEAAQAWAGDSYAWKRGATEGDAEWIGECGPWEREWTYTYGAPAPEKLTNSVAVYRLALQ